MVESKRFIKAVESVVVIIESSLVTIGEPGEVRIESFLATKGESGGNELLINNKSLSFCSGLDLISSVSY